MNRMMDDMAAWAEHLGLVEADRVKPMTMDSGVVRKPACVAALREAAAPDGLRRAQSSRGGGCKRKSKKQRQRQANAARRKVVKRLPKLSIAADSGCHLILAAKATTGAGGGQKFFAGLMPQAVSRCKITCVVAARLSSPKSDAGYDSEANHELARDEMGVRSVIPAKAGPPTDKTPSGRHRRNMKNRFGRGADKPMYGQRWQVATVNSMIKRNLESALRAVTARRRSY